MPKYSREPAVIPVLKETRVSWTVREKMVLSSGQRAGTKGQPIVIEERGPPGWGTVMSWDQKKGPNQWWHCWADDRSVGCGVRVGAGLVGTEPQSRTDALQERCANGEGQFRTKSQEWVTFSQRLLKLAIWCPLPLGRMVVLNRANTKRRGTCLLRAVRRDENPIKTGSESQL